MIRLLFLLLLLPAAVRAAAPPSFHFDFGPGPAARGYTAVPAAATYAPGGFGFDFGTHPADFDAGHGKSLLRDGVSSPHPFYFSVALPEGNYDVTLTLGHPTEAAATAVKAESRRLLLETTPTRPGEVLRRTFTLNVKSRQIDATTQVSLKPRELTKLDWDERLTLELNGPHPSLLALDIVPAPKAVTVFLAGNSTVVDQDDEPWAAWGQMLPRFLKPGVAVANHAESGLSLGSFLSSHRLDKVLSVMKPGDYLFIEFGHNDQKEKGPQDGAYGSYTERLRRFVQAARTKGGLPVIVTSTARRSFDEAGHVVNTLGDYPEAARRVAQEEKVPLIDLNRMTTQLYESLGVEESKKALVHYPANTFPDQPQPLADNTHFNPYGAYQIARCIVAGIRANHLALNRYLLPATPAYDPTHPDPVAAWQWAPSPKAAAIKPDGN